MPPRQAPIPSIHGTCTGRAIIVDLDASGALMAFERGSVQVGDESAQLTARKVRH
jgi:hypothetical protein